MCHSICSDFTPIKPSFTQRTGRFLGGAARYGGFGAAFGAAATMVTGLGGAAFTTAALLTPPVAIGAAFGAVGLLALRALNPRWARSAVGNTVLVGVLAGTLAAPPIAGVYVDKMIGPVSGILAACFMAFMGPQLARKYVLEFGPLPPQTRRNCVACARGCKQPLNN